MEWLMLIWEYILVFVFAAMPWIEIAVVIPLGIINGLNPILVALLSFLGNLSTVYLLIIFFDKYQQWREKRRAKAGEEKKTKRTERAVNIWSKYGLPGLALAGPILIGTHIAVIIAMTFGARKRASLIWLTISIGVWTIIITAASYYGFDLLGTIRGR